MSEKKSKIVALPTKLEAALSPKTDAAIFFDNPEELANQLKKVAEVDATRNSKSPDKPAARVTSLNSFITNNPNGLISVTKKDSDDADVMINVASFRKPEKK